MCKRNEYEKNTKKIRKKFFTRKEVPITLPKFGLFRNLEDFPTDLKLFLDRLKFLLSHGYNIVATWELRSWFPVVLKDILIEYKKWGNTYPVRFNSFEEWKGIIDRLIELLEWMNEGNPVYENWDFGEREASMENAKEEFFKLFSENFWDFWD